MELTLNLVWVCVAIAGILVEIVTLSRPVGSPASTSPSRKVVAMGCALVILFFVISMTDDLHDQVLVWEESKHSRMSLGAKNLVSAASARLISRDFMASFLPVVSPPVAEWSQGLARFDLPFLPAVERESVLGRAPPTSLL